MCCYAVGRAPRQTIGRRAARTGRVGKQHVSDLRNDLAVQLDVFAEQFRADSYETPMIFTPRERLVTSPFLDRFSKS